ncbi:MAG: Zn-ribbon domain-containing OB-fold protein [Candidatus Diapherotrites archaeon]|nr:Zn-ribbon domain-containing OB-fold protein [Candidatus Diapherotrites archaeon]
MFRDSPIIRWRHYNDRYRLVGYRCTKCEKAYLDKKGMCTCGNLDFTEQEFSGVGKIVAYTQIHSGPEVFESKSPYCVAVIDLKEGARIEAQVVDCRYSDLKQGLEVEAVFRKFYTSGEKGVIHYGTKFVPKY